MEAPSVLQLAQRGVITLPKSLRDRYRLNTGDTLTLLDLGGVFILTPRLSEVDFLANQIAEAMVERGESLEEVLQTLRQVREQDTDLPDGA